MRASWYFADGEKQLAIVTADYGQFSLQYNKVLLEAIQGATGIPPEHVVINCSHTHNAPGVDGREMSEASEAWLATCLAELVKDAVGKLETGDFACRTCACPSRI